MSKCCVLQLAEGGLTQTSPLRINSLFAATDTNLQSAEFVCRVKKNNQRLSGEARCLSAVRRLSFRSPALIYQTRVEKHEDSCVANCATPEPACDLWNVFIRLVPPHQRPDVDKCGG